jgi:hypothetical protein
MCQKDTKIIPVFLSEFEEMVFHISKAHPNLFENLESIMRNVK